MIVVLLGPPGSGKGTQGERVAAALGVPKISTGDVLRAAAKAGTTLGLAAKAFMDRGDLVPDPVILGIMKEALSSPEQARGVVLDGVVRTVPQAEGLARVAVEIGKRVDVVLLFEIEDELLVSRLSARTTCGACQTPFAGRQPGETHAECTANPKGTLVRRVDDEPDSIRNRLRVYKAQTEPVVAWYRANGGNVQAIDATGSFADVEARALRAVGR